MAAAVNPFLSSTECIKIIKIINRIAPAAPMHRRRRAYRRVRMEAYLLTDCCVSLLFALSRRGLV